MKSKLGIETVKTHGKRSQNQRLLLQFCHQRRRSNKLLKMLISGDEFKPPVFSYPNVLLGRQQTINSSVKKIATRYRVRYFRGSSQILTNQNPGNSAFSLLIG